ncbi:hypothetical protein [Nesterenkonia ebinurensis]|uniref:hypothetical protein n=1 Tax=Nesterenkonia ebinurensis TaxID=2608252 RepID=UPI00123CF2AA|nr:hypothetical protein [Nesterenkonia ebinurensis]
MTRTFAALLTCLLLGVTMIAASQITEQTGAAVQTTVSENWRGHYDLLVTPQGGLTDSAEETGGLIEQNFASLTGEAHITEYELDSIATMPEVEVAAPLAFIGQFASPALEAPVGAMVEEWDENGFFDDARAFKGAVSIMYDDGMQLRHLQSSPSESLFLTGLDNVTIPEWDPEAGETTYSSEDVPSLKIFDVVESIRCECDTWRDAGNAENQDPDQPAVLYDTFEVVPELYSSMVAVDPQSERELIGEAGGFLDTLIEFEEAQRSTGEEPCEGDPLAERPPGECLADLVDRERYPHIHERVFSGNSELIWDDADTDFEAIDWEDLDFDEDGLPIGVDGVEHVQAGPIIPIVYSETEYPELIAEAAFPEMAVFEGLDLDAASEYENYGEIVYEDPPADAEVHTVNITENLVPFIPQLNVGFALEGTEEPTRFAEAETAQVTPDWMPGRIQRSEAEGEKLEDAPENVEAALVNEPQGFHVLDAERTSREQRYRPWYRNLDFDARPPNGTLLVPVDSYTPGEVIDVDSASYVPLGLYAPAESTIVQPGEHEGGNLPPSFSGRGALLNSPGVITTLDAYHSYREELRVDVVRVRVAGVEEYSPENLNRIGEVASHIEDLGLEVRVVAGSSLAPVGVYLPEFFEDRTDLGWTVEEWTSLGAAVQVEDAQLTASWLLLTVALAGVATLACAVQLAGIRTRRKEAALLTSLGWPRTRVRRWFLSEDLPLAIMTTAAATLAILLSTSILPRVAAASAAAALLVTILVTAIGAASAKTQPGRSRNVSSSGAAARTPSGIGRRLALASPLAMTLSALSLLVLVSTASAFVVVILTSRTQAGVTRIANLVNAEVLLPQTVLAAGAVTAGVLMFGMGIRQSLRQAGRQHVMLRAVGWSRHDLGTCLRTQLLTSLLPGVALSLLFGLAALAAMDVTAVGPVSLVILGVPLIAIAVALSWAARHIRSV